jgi:predicted nucleic acid-binding protein
MYDKPLTLEAAWQTYSAIRNDPAVVYVREPSRVDLHMTRFVESGLVKPRTLTDAHLAATATAGTMRIVSLDSDFKQFEGLTFLHLTS